MRVRMTGELESVGVDQAHLRVGDVTHELLLSPWSASMLEQRVGERLSLRTREVLESQGQGSSFLPRLFGFVDERERALHELLVSVKGFGARKALRALAGAPEEVARAIASGDLTYLKGLPEIGKRTAETIVLELRDKVGSLGVVIDDPDRPTPTASPGVEGEAEGAVAALVQLGEHEALARELVAKAVASDASLEGASSDRLLAAALALRS